MTQEEHAQQARKFIEKELNAMQTPEKWTLHKKEQIGEIVGDMDMQKCEQFAEKLNKEFLDVVRECGGAKMNTDWRDKSNEEKLKFAQKIINNLVRRLNVGFMNVHKSGDVSGNIYDRLILDHIATNTPDINVTESASGLMSVSNDGKLRINMAWPFYQKDLACFLADLRHEMMHVVDMFLPWHSALRSDVRKRAIRYYLDPKEDKSLYEKNPLEVNANLKRKEFLRDCRAMFAEQQFVDAKNMNFGVMNNCRGAH